MMNLMEEIGAALRGMPRALVAVSIAVAASLGMTAVFSVVDAALIVPLPGANREQMVVAILVSRTIETSSAGHLRVHAGVRQLDEPATFSMLAELSVEGPSGVISVSGAWPAGIAGCAEPADAEQRRAA